MNASNDASEASLEPAAVPASSLVERLLGTGTNRAYRVAAIGFGLVMATMVLGLWYHGADYYRLSTIDRVDSLAHERLRASGPVGHFYGIIGTLLILVNLVYFLRKHLRSMRGRGSLRGWMEVHVFAGLGGSALIVFHSAFRARNQVALLAAWSLGILVTTGLLGRYLYGLLPRRSDGEELNDEGVRETPGTGGRRELAEVLDDGAAARALFMLLAPASRTPPGPVRALVLLPGILLNPLKDWLALRRIDAILAATPIGAADRARLCEVARDIRMRETRTRTVVVVHDVFIWWRALHRAFAFVMVGAMLIHVGVALYFGYRWLF